jgi:hypothetical protein
MLRIGCTALALVALLVAELPLLVALSQRLTSQGSRTGCTCSTARVCFNCCLGTPALLTWNTSWWLAVGAAWILAPVAALEVTGQVSLEKIAVAGLAQKHNC